MNTPQQICHFRSVLDAEQLMQEAQLKTGLGDYGCLNFVKPLRRLLERAATEVAFTPNGLEVYRKHIISRFLVNRLRIEYDFQRHPEIFDEDVSDPVVVIGLPRSGTTKLQRTIATAPQLQKPILWKLVNPAPFPEAEEGKLDPRIAASKFAFGDFSSEVDAGHMMVDEEAEEEILLFDFAFNDSVNGYSNYLPLFFTDDWLADASASDSYRYVYRLLQYLQWQDGGKRNRPWILKAIIHIAHVDELLAVFPNATLVHSHRDPRQSIPSMCKLMQAIWATKAEGIDDHFIGQGILTWGSTAIDRYLEARERLNLDERILDVSYEQVRGDVISIARQIYQRAGLVWTKEAEQGIVQWQVNNKQHQHGSHNYTLAEFGLNEQMIDEAFETYIERFIERA